MNRACNYGEYFRPGQRARVELMLQDGGIFLEWAEIDSVEAERIALRLSRDTLPAGVRLDQEAPVVVRVGHDGGASTSGYSCRTAVISGGPGGELEVKCLEEVKFDNLREFYRLSAEIPVTLFNLSGGESLFNIPAPQAPTVQGIPSRIVNISGGGIRTETTMQTAEGDIVYATFHLPLPEPKAVPLVAQVVHCEPLGDGGEEVYSTGLRYLHINERDRDSIVRFVCNEEIRRLRLYKKEYYSLPDGSLPEA